MQKVTNKLIAALATLCVAFVYRLSATTSFLLDNVAGTQLLSNEDSNAPVISNKIENQQNLNIE